MHDGRRKARRTTTDARRSTEIPTEIHREAHRDAPWTWNFDSCKKCNIKVAEASTLSTVFLRFFPRCCVEHAINLWRVPSSRADIFLYTLQFPCFEKNFFVATRSSRVKCIMYRTSLNAPNILQPISGVPFKNC